MIEEHPAGGPGPKPGDVVAGYRLESRVAAGGMAVVYRARDERLGRVVALKVLSPELARDAAFRRRFIGESDAIIAVDHLLMAHVEDQPPPLTARRPDLPAAADRVMAKALAKTPAQRYPTCTGFAEALRAAFGLPAYYAGPAASARDAATVSHSKTLTVTGLTGGPGQSRAERGDSSAGQQMLEQALADCNRMLELNPDNAAALSRRGSTYRLMGRYDQALADLDRALELNPDNDSAHAHRGATYLGMGRYDQALTDLNYSLERNPDDAWAHVWRGDTYRMMGRYHQALADLDRALERNPDNAWARAERNKALRHRRGPLRPSRLLGLLPARPALRGRVGG